MDSSQPGTPSLETYLSAGFFEADGVTLRAALKNELAAAMGRELLIQGGIPVLKRVIGELERSWRLAGGWEECRARLRVVITHPDYQHPPLLRRLLVAGVALVRVSGDLSALITHLKRVLILGSFAQALTLGTVKEAQAIKLTKRPRLKKPSK